MKTKLLFCTIAVAIFFTGCSGAQGNIDLHKTLALVMILILIALFFVLALYSNLLRDTVDCDVIDAKVEQAKARGIFKFQRNTAPFSLSRVQLAVWTVIISSCYIYLYFCKGAYCPNPNINQTALILMGIGAAVTASGALIDQNDIQNNLTRHQNTPSGGFFNDILSDAQGISIPRFQNVIWTAIAMVVYVTKVYMIKTNCGGLPELDATLLSLTGISNATYVALKTQENNTPAASPAIPPVNPAPQPSPVQPVAPIVPSQPVAPVQPIIPPAAPVQPVVAAVATPMPAPGSQQVIPSPAPPAPVVPIPSPTPIPMPTASNETTPPVEPAPGD